jgi:hypothetical protein
VRRRCIVIGMANNQPDIRVLEGPTRGQAAYEGIQALLTALADDELMAPNVDMSAAAIGAIGVAERAREASLLARLQSLPPGEFDAAKIDLLGILGWAALHVVTRTSQTRGQGRTKLPPSLVEPAVELETRMQTCCEYHLGDHPEAGVEVARLRSGQGYRDLAADLLGYAELYRTYRDVLSMDLKYYRDTDEPEAVRMGEQIYTLLGEAATAETPISSIEARRVWTLLVRTYEDVATTGQWLLRNEPRRAERLFPSLFRVSRTSRRRRSGEPADETAPGTEPTSPGEGSTPAVSGPAIS